MDTLFCEGLKENDIVKLLSVPKSDLHNHSTKGCRREWLAEQLHVVIPKPPQKLDGLVTRLENAEKTFFGIHNTELKRLISGLNALSPLKVLERGYSIASKNGKTVGSVYDVNENDKISVKMKDGVLICTVDGKEVD